MTETAQESSYHSNMGLQELAEGLSTGLNESQILEPYSPLEQTVQGTEPKEIGLVEYVKAQRPKLRNLKDNNQGSNGVGSAVMALGLFGLGAVAFYPIISENFGEKLMSIALVFSLPALAVGYFVRRANRGRGMNYKQSTDEVMKNE